ncbi:MAG: tetratricopeptide repeat protein [Vicinamibacterales bacterium]
MKTTERHHLKTNELADPSPARGKFWSSASAPSPRLVVAAVLVVAIAGISASGVAQSRAGAMLAEAMAVMTAPRHAAPMSTTGGTTPPPQPGAYQTEAARAQAAIEKFMAAANDAPEHSGRAPRPLPSGGKWPRRASWSIPRQQFLELIKLDSSRSIPGEWRSWGWRKCRCAPAASSRASSRRFRGGHGRRRPAARWCPPRLQLARAYTVAGKPTEAKQTLNRIIDEFPQSPYVGEAKRQVEALAGGASADSARLSRGRGPDEGAAPWFGPRTADKGSPRDVYPQPLLRPSATPVSESLSVLVLSDPGSRFGPSRRARVQADARRPRVTSTRSKRSAARSTPASTTWRWSPTS